MPTRNTNQPIINNAKKSSYYKEGAKACIAKEARDTNPYEPLTFKYSEWDRGWFKIFMIGKPIG